jgi:ergothioneine biosynthesis protein EgtB
VNEVLEYREVVDRAMVALIHESDPGVWPEVARRVALGLNHEQQHQELLLTDIKQNFSVNPLYPAYRTDLPAPAPGPASPAQWVPLPGGEIWIGHAGGGFGFDNEGPRHRVWLDPYRLASRPTTNAEYLRFMEDGGYRCPTLWLADGWAIVRREGWEAPLHWRQVDGAWWEYTLGGLLPLDPDAPVAHVSYYEADAYARWADARLPTEQEWEAASGRAAPGANLRDSGYLRPCPASPGAGPLLQMFGDVWEWTASPYLAYPGYRQESGAFGEYNGKFMCNQWVVRGGSCVTPAEHIRPSYRNFFYPHDRWQFLGFRLAN